MDDLLTIDLNPHARPDLGAVIRHADGPMSDDATEFLRWIRPLGDADTAIFSATQAAGAPVTGLPTHRATSPEDQGNPSGDAGILMDGSGPFELQAIAAGAGASPVPGGMPTGTGSAHHPPGAEQPAPFGINRQFRSQGPTATPLPTTRAPSKGGVERPAPIEQRPGQAELPPKANADRARYSASPGAGPRPRHAQEGGDTPAHRGLAPAHGAALDRDGAVLQTRIEPHIGSDEPVAKKRADVQPATRGRGPVKTDATGSHAMAPDARPARGASLPDAGQMVRSATVRQPPGASLDAHPPPTGDVAPEGGSTSARVAAAGLTLAQPIVTATRGASRPAPNAPLVPTPTTAGPKTDADPHPVNRGTNGLAPDKDPRAPRPKAQVAGGGPNMGAIPQPAGANDRVPAPSAEDTAAPPGPPDSRTEIAVALRPLARPERTQGPQNVRSQAAPHDVARDASTLPDAPDMLTDGLGLGSAEGRPIAPPQGTAGPMAPAHGTAAQIAQNILRTIGDARPEPGTLVEVALDPPELGKLRVGVVETPAGLSLTIMAERAETADLMRRHMALLSDELGKSGFDAAGVNVGQDPSGRQDAPRETARPHSEHAADADATPDPALGPAHHRARGETGLDLRL